MYLILINTFLLEEAHEIRLTPAAYGYARVRLPTEFGGAMIEAHALSCILAHGARPEGKLALHSCRHRYCYYSGHLRWGTPDDNHLDAVKDGTVSYRIQPEDRVAVREAYAMGTRIATLARQYDVSPTTIGRIVRSTIR